MSDWHFSAPVRLCFGPASERTVTNAWEAIEVLRRDWPGQRDRWYQLALHACQDAIDGFRPGRIARKALVRAARMAGFRVTST
ncbi:MULTISPECIES: DUF982 domain-containing protein [unclassified Chelatococcus]|uniref:DUF982 domain-containing protein n=1 Tax=unclassified Chelatococcus TaxID=2638111 RepID=UPI001BCF4822|nr:MULTISPECIES: DUF982 domain-containing protein [unclassified Chelatococcus]MBS7700015.1 DUF982 domain-containing protein [Chelatococcus sp. YT9]MBX3558560.1 DUF982 domain-containing protein [Chelatococcus sp.]